VTTFSALRRVSPAVAAARARLTPELAARVAEPPVQAGPWVRLTASGAQTREWTVYVRAVALARALFDDTEISAELVDMRMLLDVLGNDARCAAALLAPFVPDAAEFVASAEHFDEPPAAVVCLNTDGALGPVCPADDFALAQMCAGNASRETQGIGDLPAPVSFRLPAAPLCASELAVLAPRDIVLASTLSGRSYVNGHLHGAFLLEQENIMIESNDPAYKANADLSGDDQAVDVMALPLTVEIVVAERLMRIGELGDLRPGAVIPVTADAIHNARLVVSGRTVATGELVQVGDALGIEIARVDVR
jgi:type III secretion system YscQ/HrcQ family protein